MTPLSSPLRTTYENSKRRRARIAKRRRRLHLETCEDRSVPSTVGATWSDWSTPLQMPACPALPAATLPTGRTELVFIDPRVDNYRGLVSDLQARSTPQRQFEIVVLSTQRDGIDQISSVLARYRDVDAVHFVSHGNERGVQLGGSWVDQATLAAKAQRVAGWSQALRPGADLLFYGCDLAAGEEGRVLLDAMRTLTGADVAASNDRTGAAALGGDWLLEFGRGTIETSVAFSGATQSTYDGVFATFTVTSLANSGVGTLRQAILNANASAGADLINFSFGGTAIRQIVLTSPLPTLSDVTIIDATTLAGYAGTPIIELVGSSAGSPAIGLDLRATCTVRGLSIHSFSGTAIHIDSSADKSVIEANHLGLDGTGKVALPNGGYGVETVNAEDVRIGGPAAAQRNLIAANKLGGLLLTDGNTTRAIVQGNWIGIDVNGNAAGNGGHGILIVNDAAGNLIGGTGAGEGNVIAHSTGDGIRILDDGVSNRILGNSIYANGGLGIDLDGDGVTPNDPGDGDSGANDDKNFPVLQTVTRNGSQITFTGTYNSIANTQYRLEFFANSSPDPSGHGEGEMFLGFAVVTTDGSGNVSFSVTFTAAIPDGATVAATATDLNNDNTSEFSKAPTVPTIRVLPTGGLVTTEAGGKATFTVVLTSAPTGSVTVPLSVSNPAEGSLSTTSVVFTTANWNVPQTVTITGVDDFIDDGDQPYTVIVGATSSTDAAYNNYDAPDVSVVNTDNDAAGFVVTPTSGLVTTEAGGQASFTVRLTSQPTAPVTISVTSSIPGEGAPSVATLIFTAANWNLPQTVTITGTDDFVDDGDQPYTIILGAASSSDAAYNGLNPADVSATNVDNDAVGFVVSPTTGLVTTEAGGQASFTVRLTSQPTGPVTISVISSNPAEGTPNVASLTFTPANWNIAQTVTITSVDDSIDDGDQPYTIILGAASSADAKYNGLDPADVSATNLDDDTVGITVTPGGPFVTTEAGGQGSLTVVLTSQPTGPVTISILSSNPSEGTVSVGSLTFTAADWYTPQTVWVTGVDDFVADGDQGFTIIIGAAVSGDGKYNGIDPADLAFVNKDNDKAGIVVSPTSGLTTTEAGGQASFTVVLTSQPTAPVTITFTSTDPSEGTTVASITFTAANWSTPQTVTVAGVDELVDDGDQAYSVNLAVSSGDATYQALTPSSVALTNIDNDTAGISVSPTSGLVTTEAGGQATFTVVLTSQPTAPVTITFTSTNPGEGATAVGSITFTALNWNLPQTVTVAGVDDAIDDGDQPYTINLGVASGDATYQALTPSSVSAVNVDNDAVGIVVTPTSGLVTTEAGAQATFTVVLTSQPTAPVTISVVSSNPAEGTVSVASLTFTAANWNVAQTVTITGVNEFIDDGDQGYSIVLGQAASADAKYAAIDPTDVSVTNIDDDTAGIIVSPTTGLVTTEAGGQATFTVVLTSQPTAPVTITVSSSKTGEGTVSVATLTFTAGNWNAPQLVTITGVDEFIDDGDQGYTIVLTSASADGTYAAIDPTDVSVTNIDNDSAGIIVTPTTGLVTTEAGGQSSFTVVLTSQPTSPVTVFVTSTNTAEGTVSVASLTFTAANWNAPQTVTITGVDELVDDGDQGYTIVLTTSTADGNYAVIDPNDVSVTNIDNDSTGIVVTPTSGLVTTEAGGQASFTVVLTSQPIAPVTIFINSSNTGEGVTSVLSLTFTAANWNVAQTVTITGVDEFIDDGNQPYTIVLTTSTTDPTYAPIDPADVAVTNVDDDTAGIVVSPTSGLVTTEAGAQATFTVVLTSQPTAPVTIFVNSSNTGEGTVSVVSLTFTAANWNVAQTVTITGVDEFIDDGNQAYTIVLGQSSVDPLYAAIDPTDVSVTNIDNDTVGIVVTPTTGLVTTEAGGQASFTVVLTSQPIAAVTVFVSSTNTAEGTVSVASVTFTAANWNTPQTVTITGVDEFVDDGDQGYTIVLTTSTADPLYAAIDPTDVAVTNVDNDTAGIIVTPTSGLITTEAGGQATFTVVLTSQPVAPVTVLVGSSNSGEGTVSVASVTFTAANWNTPQTVTITGVDEFVDDGNQPYTIVLTTSTADAKYAAIDPADVSITNIDNDTAGIIVTPTSGLVTTEAGGQASFNVVLTSQPVVAVTVLVGSSNAGEGVTNVVSLTFTAANWNIVQTVTVTGVNEWIDDGNQGYTIVLTTSTADGNYTLIDPTDVSVTNIDDDTAGFIVTPTSGLVTTEAGGQAGFTVVLTSQPVAPVTVLVSSSNSAEGTVSVNSLTFTAANWNIAQTVTVTGADEFIDDGDQAYTIVLSSVTADANYAVLDPTDVAVTNLDDDTVGVVVTPTSGLVTTEAGGQASFTVVLTSQPIAPVTVFVNSSNTAEGTVSVVSVTFTAANWNIAQTVTITGADEWIDDGNQAYTIILTSSTADAKYAAINPADVAVTNVDDDTAGIVVTPTSGLVTTEAGGQASFSVVLSSQPLASVTVFVNSSNTGEGTVNVVSVTFTAANWNVAQTVTITGVDEFIDDGDQAFTIVLSQAGSADAKYAALNPADVSATNIDDDIAGIRIIVSSSTNPVTTEAGGKASFTIALSSQPLAPVTISFASSNTAEGTVGGTSLTFTPANWNVPQTVTVTGVDDFVADGDQAFVVTLGPATSADGKYHGTTGPDQSFTNRDDDVAGIMVFANGILELTESGGSATFSVRLRSQPVGVVIIGLNVDNLPEGTLSANSLIFSPTTWNIPQTVKLTGRDDFVVDGDIVFRVQIATQSSADVRYGGMTAPDLAAINRDDDVAGFRLIAAPDLWTNENGGQAVVYLVLTSQPTTVVTVILDTSNYGEVTVLTSAINFGPDDWNQPKAALLQGVADGKVDDDAVVIVTAIASSDDPNYQALMRSANVTNRNVDFNGLNPQNNPPPNPTPTTNPPPPGGTLNDPPPPFSPNDPVGPREEDLSAGRGGGGGGEEAALAGAVLDGSRPALGPADVTTNVASESTGVLTPQGSMPAAPGNSLTLPTPRWRRTEALAQAMEKVSRQFEEERVHRASTARVTLGTAAIATAGYLLWTLRGVAWLASAVASSAPSWRMLDPLSVLKRRREDDADDEALEDLAKGIDKSATP